MTTKMIRPAAILAVLSLAGAAHAQTSGFWFLPLEQGERDIGVYWLSRDGTKAAGGVAYTSSSRGGAPFVWTAAGGRQVIDDGIPSQNEDIRGMSLDGQTMAGNLGQNGVAYSARPYRRVGSGPFAQLPTPAGFLYSFTAGMSDDGNVVAGTWTQRVQSTFNHQPFVWTPQGGMVLLGQLNYEAQTAALSRDGTTVVGTPAFVWTQQSGFQPLQGPPGAIYWAPFAVNTSGAIIAGNYALNGSSGGLVRWVNGVPQPLQGDMTPVGVSDDGTVIPGNITTTPYVWPGASGMVPAADYFRSHSVSLPTGLTLYALTNMSPDGRTFAGRCNLGGVDGAYVVTLPRVCGSADFDGDGDAGTDQDIEAFFKCVAGDCCAGCGSADFDGDGDVGTDSDIEAFFRVLAGGQC